MSDEYHLPPGSIQRYSAPKPLRYTMNDLERETGLSGRTIRYYITIGLLQPAYGRGKSATYDSDHLMRLHLIQKLKAERMELEEIRERLSLLDTEDVAEVLQIRTRPGAANWMRYQMHPDLEISIRELPIERQSGKQLHAFDLILEYARSVIDDLERTTDGQ